MPESISCNIGLSRFRTTEGLMPVLGQLSPWYTSLNPHSALNLAATDVCLLMVTRGSQIQVLVSQDLGQQRLVLVSSGEKHRVRTGVNPRVCVLTDARRHCTMRPWPPCGLSPEMSLDRQRAIASPRLPPLGGKASTTDLAFPPATFMVSMLGS